MSNYFKEKVNNEFNKERNFSQIMSKKERKMYMKLRYLVPVCAVILCVIGLVSYNSSINENFEIAKNNEIIENNININQIENLATSKLMAESKVVEKEELPEDISYVADLKIKDGLDLSMITALYTKTDFEKEEFDLLHDYVFMFFDEAGKASVKISVSKEDTPLRDYFFDGAEDLSEVAGKEVKIFKYEDRYIVNYVGNEIHIDIETQGLLENEMIELIQKVIK